MRKFLFVLFGFAAGFAVFFLVSVSSSAAYDTGSYTKGFFTVNGHGYTGKSPTRLTEVINFGVGSTLQSNGFEFYYEWNGSIDIYINLSDSWVQNNETVSGYLAFPIQFAYEINEELIDDQQDIDSPYHPTYNGYFQTGDYNVIPNFSNTDHITFNYFSIGSTYWVSVLLDHVNIDSLRDNDNSFKISIPFLLTASFYYQNAECFILNNRTIFNHYDYFLEYFFQPKTPVATWVSSLSADTNLNMQISNGINNSTDIDTILTYLYAIRGSSTTIAEVVPYVQNIDSVLSSLYNYITSQSTSYNTLLSSISSYTSYTSQTLEDLYQLLDEGAIPDSLADQLTELQTIKTDLSTLAWLFRLYFNSYTFDYNDPYKTRMAAGWVNIIKTALSDFDVTIQLDQDTNVNIEVTNNDVKNIYNNQQTVNNFETDIIFDFQSYIRNVPFSMIDPQNGPTGLVQAVAVGKGWIESMYNALGPYNYLVVITLLVGLVAGIIGPINKFAADHIGRGGSGYSGGHGVGFHK